MIVRALDEYEYVLMASIDLSLAFDVENIRLILKYLELQLDIVKLIEVWLKNRMFYLKASGNTSNFLQTDSGTIQA